MNIFAVDEDPVISARSLIDKHIVKMTLESAQLLCTVAHKKSFSAVYKSTHKNHPATLWLEKSSANWNWLCMHGIALSEEYTSRYKKIHKCQTIIQEMMDRTEEIWKENKHYSQHTPFAQCMPDEYRQNDPVKAYRAYYRVEKRPFAAWTEPGKIPDWF